jgi:hypothetical protein
MIYFACGHPKTDENCKKSRDGDRIRLRCGECLRVYDRDRHARRTTTLVSKPPNYKPYSSERKPDYALASHMMLRRQLETGQHDWSDPAALKIVAQHVGVRL